MKEKFVISIISQLLIQIFTIISNYFLILFLDVELMGIWTLLNSLINIGFIFNDLGLTLIHYQYSEKGNFDEYFGSFFIIKFVLILINIVFSFILIIFFGLWESVYFPIILLLLFSNVITSLLNTFSIHLRSKLKVFKTELPLLIFTTSQNILITFIAFNISYIVNPLFWISMILILNNILYAFVIITMSKKDFKFNKPNKTFILEYLKGTKYLMVFTIISILTVNIGNVILAYSFNNENLAYIYLVTGYILPIITMFTVSMISLCTPLYSKFLSKSDYTSLKKIVYTIEKYISILILSIIILIFLIGDKIFLIFLPKYLKSLPILYILIFYSYLEGINRNYGIVLISGKKQKLSANMSIIFMTFRLILFFILIPKTFLYFEMLGLGTLGFALALIIPMIILTVILRVLNKKLFNLNLQKKLLLHAPIAFFTIIIMTILNNNILENLIHDDIILIIILTGLALPFFIILLFVSRVLTKNDIKFFFELLKLSRYKKSMKSEF